MGLFEYEKSLKKGIEVFKKAREAAARVEIKDPEQVAAVRFPKTRVRVDEQFYPGERKPLYKMPESIGVPPASTIGGEYGEIEDFGRKWKVRTGYKKVPSIISEDPYTGKKKFYEPPEPGAAKKVGRQYEAVSEPYDYRNTPNVAGSGKLKAWEEIPPQKQRVDVTDAQWKRYLERIADRTPSGETQTRVIPGQGEQQVPIGMGSKAAMGAMDAPVAPQVTPGLFSRVKALNPEKDQMIGNRKILGYDTQDLPADQAYQMLLQDNPAMGGPGKYIAHDQPIPPARILQNTPEGPQYEERKYTSLAPKIKQAVESLKASKIEKGGAKLAPLSGEELAKKTSALEDLWVFIGKGGSATGRMFTKLKDNAKGRYKVASVKDYFFRVGYKWLTDPEGTKETYPREVKLLEEAWATRHAKE